MEEPDGVPPARLAPTTVETATIVRPDPVARRMLGSSGIEVFPIALDAAGLIRLDESAGHDILDAFVRYGGDLVDVGSGDPAPLAEWMRRRGDRDAISVAATVVADPAEPAAVSARVDALLTALGTDRLELLAVALTDDDTAFAETLFVVDELIRAGKVRSFAGSEPAGERLLEARIASAQLGVAPMVAVATPYSLADREPFESTLARAATGLQLAVLPRVPLAHGFLRGGVRERSALSAEDRKGPLGRYLNRAGLKVLAAVDEVAAELDATPATVALAWLLTREQVVAPIAEAERAEDVVELTAAASVRLTRAQVAVLDRASE